MIEKLVLNMGINAMKENFLALDDETKQKEFNKLLDEKIELQQENKQLKDKIDKAIEWVHKHISKYNCKGITIIDWDELSNPNDLLEILGDKENEET